MKLLRRLLVLALVLANVSVAEATNVSWYGKKFHGRRTASGERFNMNAYTAASKTLRFGTKLKLTYRGNTVIVRVNDRGPYVRGRQLDVSKAAAQKLHCPGVCKMKMEVVK